MENGIIAVTGEDISTYRIDSSSFKVEILDLEGDWPVPAGDVGRLVVTDLFNYGMPFIRYDTGDLAAWAKDRDGKVEETSITRIAGRRLDTITVSRGENPLTAHALQIWAPTAKLTEIRQFQLRQHDVGHFTWVLNAEKSDSLEDTLRAILVDRIGPIERVNYEYVTEVPVLSSGKRQFFVNELNRTEGESR